MPPYVYFSKSVSMGSPSIRSLVSYGKKAYVLRQHLNTTPMKSYTFTLCLFLFAFSLSGQHFEAGLRVGGANYLGDLTASRTWTSVGETNLHLGLIGRYHVHDFFTLRGGLNYGAISSNDSRSFRDQTRFRRNLSFRSNVWEIALATEINIHRYEPRGLEHRMSPYILIGVGLFRFNPKTYYNGEWVALQPLGTEGQGMPDHPKKYSLTQIAIPLGVGIKYAFSEQWTVSFEYSMRKTFTDYLDDTSEFYPDLDQLRQVNGELAGELSWRTDEVDPDARPPAPGSQRGDPNDQDWYIFTGVTLTYNFIKSNIFRTRKKTNKGKLSCPKVRKRKGLGKLLIGN